MSMDEYRRLRDIKLEAERDTEAIVAEVDAILSRFVRSKWKQSRVIGLPDPSPEILNTKYPVDVSLLPSIWSKLQIAMARYAEAELSARAAWNKLDEEEQRIFNQGQQPYADP